MNIQTDRAFVRAGTATVRYLTVTITAPRREARTDRPAAHVALVLDRSGSMAGRKIDMAKKAVEHAVRLVNDRDRLALALAEYAHLGRTIDQMTRDHAARNEPPAP